MAIISRLMVCEKPGAAARIAYAIDERGQPKRHDAQGVTYYECSTKSGNIVVCSALGHLYGVGSKGKSSRRSYPVWDFVWRPKHELELGSARLARWVRVISSLARQAEGFVNSCDYDIEGSLMGQTILQYACNGAHTRAGRMKLSTLTEREIRLAFRNLSSQPDLQADAGRCRHELDWLYGINLSRLMTESVVKQRGGYAALTTGRVQGPTLRFVVEREEAIGSFVPTPFWKISASIELQGKEFETEYYKERIPTFSEANLVVSECKGRPLDVKDCETREFQQMPPYPFDLSTLQSEAYRHFRYSPAKTLACAERLYLDALISYPRTSSQRLPPDIGYENILRELSSRREYRAMAAKLLSLGNLRPTQGTKYDPAHPSIYPTGELAPSKGPESRIYDLIVRRFMSTFADPSLLESSRITLEYGIHKFYIRGSRILKAGWIEFYQSYLVEGTQELPSLTAGQQVYLHRLNATEKFTQPPSRYNPASLLKRMEEENIGTKSTRAEIVEILYRRGYIRGQKIRATTLGHEVIQILSTYCPLVIDPKFTAELEEQMERIHHGTTSRRLVLFKALDQLRPVMLGLVDKEEELGAKLAEVVSADRIAAVTFEVPCPQCNSTLKIVRNKKTGKRFVGCTGKWERACSFSLPLPQFGKISILSRRCKVCGFQLIQVGSKRRRLLVSCQRCYLVKIRLEMKSVPERRVPAIGVQGVERAI